MFWSIVFAILFIFIGIPIILRLLVSKVFWISVTAIFGFISFITGFILLIFSDKTFAMLFWLIGFLFSLPIIFSTKHKEEIEQQHKSFKLTKEN